MCVVSLAERCTSLYGPRPVQVFDPDLDSAAARERLTADYSLVLVAERMAESIAVFSMALGLTFDEEATPELVASYRAATAASGAVAATAAQMRECSGAGDFGADLELYALASTTLSQRLEEAGPEVFYDAERLRTAGVGDVVV